MKSTVEALEGNRVKLAVEVDETEFGRDVDAAFRKLAREVRLPGFRPGKAPRRVLEAHIGIAPAREQALRDAVPAYLARAVREHDVDIIAPPEVDITSPGDEGRVAFEATFEVRPQVIVPGYGGLRVELPPLDVDDAELDGVIGEELRRHGDLGDVERAAEMGDYLTLDVSATRDGEPVPGLSTEDWLYELGRGWIADDFDERLVGTRAGAELGFRATPRGTEAEADFEVSVKSVQTLVPPELTDEWVGEHIGDVDSVAAWRDSLRSRLEAQRLEMARHRLVSETASAVANLVDEEPPEALVQSELQSRAQQLTRNLQSQNVPLEQYLAATGEDPSAFGGRLRREASEAVKVDLALRAVADAEDIEVTDEELEAEYARIAASVSQKPGQVKRAYEHNDAVGSLRNELRKSKALDWLLHHVEVVDPDGHPIDRARILDQTGTDGVEVTEASSAADPLAAADQPQETAVP